LLRIHFIIFQHYCYYCYHTHFTILLKIQYSITRNLSV